MTKPTDGIPYWAKNLILDPVTQAPNRTQPSAGFQSSGLILEEPLYRGHLNWQLDSIARWIEYHEEVVADYEARLTALGG